MGLGALTGEEIPGDRSSERDAASKVVLGPNTACNGYKKKMLLHAHSKQMPAVGQPHAWPSWKKCQHGPR